MKVIVSLLLVIGFTVQAQELTKPPFSHGTCDNLVEADGLRCTDNQGNVCFIVEYSTGHISFGCRNVKDNKVDTASK